MKYIALMLFLVGCSTAPKPKLYTYECVALGRHGVYAKWEGEYYSEIAAQEDGEIIRKQLVEAGAIGNNTGVMCYPENKQD